MHWLIHHCRTNSAVSSLVLASVCYQINLKERSILPFDWNDKSILITGGTGSLGTALTRHLLDNYNLKRLVVFSRDELKQFDMQNDLGRHDNLRFFIGDVRDKSRLIRAMKGIDIVIHAAAMKQVPACEYNPSEAIEANILGTQNVVDAANQPLVERVRQKLQDGLAIAEVLRI